MARVTLLLFVLLLAVPSANYQVFDGLPLSRGLEFIGLILLVPLLLSRRVRGLHARWFGRRPRAFRTGLLGLGGAALAVKILLLASGTHEGFVACYGSPLAPPPAGPCERSFENPFFRFSATRVDRAISFGPNDWDLAFLNAMRFNIYPGAERGDRLRWRIPIAARWEGVIERPEPWVARVTFTGQVTVRVTPGGPDPSVAATESAAHYGRPATILVPVAAGRHILHVGYRFDDGSREGGPPPVGPWATLRIDRGRGPEGRESGGPVRSARPFVAWRALAGAADVGIALLGAPLVLFYLALLSRDVWLLALVGIATPLVDRLDLARVGLPTSLGLCALLALIAIPVLGRHWRRRLVGAYFALLYVSWFATLRTFRRLDVVMLREAGSDPIIYESQARSILETWSLEGGEAVFRMQPGFRYIRFVERLVLGDGDGLVSIVALTALYWAFCWAMAQLWPRPRPTGLRVTVFCGMAGLMLALASSPPVVYFVQASLSEYPTWVLLPLMFPLLFVSRAPRDWLRGGFLAGLSFLTRLNQLPPLLALVGVFAWRAWGLRPRLVRPVLVVAGLVLALLMLPAAHNLYYGGQLEWATGAKADGRNLVLTPGDLARITTDSTVQKRVWYQVDHMFYLHTLRDKFPRGEHVSWLAIWGIQVLWLAVALVTLSRRAATGPTKALVVLPFLYLGVHLFYQADVFYPRHIIAAHLAMALVALHAVGRGWDGRVA